MRPSYSGLEGMDLGVGERLRAIVTDRRVEDDASGRVESIHIEAEEKAVAGGGLVVEARGNAPNRCLFLALMPRLELSALMVFDTC